MKITRNFDFDKLLKSQALSEWLNQYGNRINKSIQEGLKTATDINGKRFKTGSDFTHKSVQDGHAHKRPLVRQGRLMETRKSPSTIKKLTFIIKGGIKKSKKRWNLTYEESKSSGTRKGGGINYGALHNTGYKTSDKSMIPNKTVPKREWFGIPSKFNVGGSEWNKMVGLMNFYLQKYVKTPMKEFK